MSIEFDPEPLGLNGRAAEALEDGRRWFPQQSNLVHDTLSLCGEAGEVANLVKKLDRGEKLDEHMMLRLKDEVVDVQTYLYEIMGLLDETSRRVFAREIDWEHEYDKKRGFNEDRFGKPRNPFDDLQNDISERFYPRD